MALPDNVVRSEPEGLTLSARLERTVKERPDGVALVHASSGRRITYAQLGQTVDRLARALLGLGIKKGDVISLQMPNWPEFVYAHFALAKIGAVTNPISPVFRSREVKYILHFSESVGFVVPSQGKGFDYLKMVGEMRQDIPNLRHVIVAGGDAPAGMVSLSQMIEEAGSVSEAAIPAMSQAEPEDAAILVYTSGTTADPKGVVQTHRSMVLSGMGCAKLFCLTEGETEDEVILCLPSFAASFGLYANLYSSVFHRATLVTADAFDAAETLKIIERERVTRVGLVPAHIMAMLAVPDLSSHDLSSLRLLLYAGAICPVEVAKSAVERICRRLGTIYAMTEIAPCTGTRPGDPLEVVSQTVGRPASETELQIVDDEETSVGIGETGEILVRGAGLFSGYLRQPDLTAEAMTADGWYHTGDLGWLDESGNVHIAGRKKDVINRGGLKVSSREIEDLLFTHPAVRDAAVVAMPDVKLGERMCAYIALKPGQLLSFDAMIEFLRGKDLATFKLPERLEIIEQLPYTPSGKVQKFILRNDIQSKLAKERFQDG